MSDISIAELVRNGTMSAEIAATMWAAVDQEVSFLVVAIPRFAGKSTTTEAILALRPPEVELHHVEGRPEEMARLAQERLGGYLVVAEFSQAPVPGYIWGPPVRRVFETLDAGYSLQSCLHAPSAADGILEVTRGNDVPDAQAARIKLVVYIELYGTTMRDLWRRVADLYEVDSIAEGRPSGRSLFRWRQDGDTHEMLDAPRSFQLSSEELARRAAVFQTLANSGQTSAGDVAAAVARFREAG